MPSKRVAVRPPVTDDDDDDDVPPAPSLKTASGASGLRVKRGWGEAQRQMDSTSSYAQAFKPDERGAVVKFLEDVPYAGFKRHWIRRTTKEGQSTRAYTCLRSFNASNGKPLECPLCEIGDKAQATSCFNIAVCAEDGSLALKSWEMGAKVYNLAKAFSDNPRVGPLTRNYYHVTKTGSRQQVQYNLSPVKEAALEEDYDIPVPTQEALNALDMYTEDIVQISSVKDLRELASELVDDYE